MPPPRAPKPPPAKPASTPEVASAPSSPLIGTELSTSDFHGAPAVAIVESLTMETVTLKVEVTGETLTLPIAQVDFDEGRFTYAGEPVIQPEPKLAPEPPAPTSPVAPAAAPVLTSDATPTPAAPPSAAKVTTPKLAPVAPVPARVVPLTWVLARKIGLGTYGGPFYSFPKEEKLAQAVGQVIGYFPPEIVARFPDEFVKVG